MNFFKMILEWIKKVTGLINVTTTTTTATATATGATGGNATTTTTTTTTSGGFDIPTTTTTTTGATGATGATGNGWPTNCGCDLSKVLCNPEKGAECPVPWGLDIRFRCWSPSINDTQFIGFDKNSATKSGNDITGHCFTKNGIRYHYLGYRKPSSTSKLVSELTGRYETTYRMDYNSRKV